MNADSALDKTLKNIKERLGGSNPTVLYTGNGYHIYQPIGSQRLENIQDFDFAENPSNNLLRFAKDFLSDGYADKCNNPSLRSYCSLFQQIESTLKGISLQLLIIQVGK